MTHPILTDTQAKMKKAVDHTLHEFSAIHTGKATPSMVEGVMVEAYGTQMRLKECAAITTPDARLIQVQPWDIELRKASRRRSRSPTWASTRCRRRLIRMPLPELSRERRQEFVKTAHRLAEEGRVRVRTARQPGLSPKEHPKKAKLPEDDARRMEKEIQLMTEKSIKDIDAHLAAKEKELTTV